MLGTSCAPGASLGATGVEPLYRAAAGRLEQVVGGGVNAPAAVIEDACATAWCRLVLHSACVRRDRAFGWLVATAVREAWRLSRRESRELSLETVLDEIGDGELGPVAPGADEAVEQRELIALVARLPVRQRRVLWLHTLGLSYIEMAEASGCSTRAIGREMVSARRQVRALSATLGD